MLRQTFEAGRVFLEAKALSMVWPSPLVSGFDKHLPIIPAEDIQQITPCYQSMFTSSKIIINTKIIKFSVTSINFKILMVKVFGVKIIRRIGHVLDVENK